MLPALAVKLAVVPPGATFTEGGAVNSVLLEVSAETAPPVGAAEVSVTVQVAEAPDARLVGLHTMDDSMAVAGAGAVSAIEADCELPLSVAVRLAL